MIVSHIKYCILAYGYEHNRISKLQKRVVRIIKFSNTESIFKALKLLKIEDILKLNELKFYYKYENNKLPKYFSKTQFILIYPIIVPYICFQYSINLYVSKWYPSTRS